MTVRCLGIHKEEEVAHAWVASSFMLLCMKTSSSFCVKWKSILCKEKLVSILQICGIVISVGKD